MFLHLGRDVVISMKYIIGIFDLDNTSVSNITRDFLKRAEKKQCVLNVSEGLPRSFVVVQEGKREKVYFTNISSVTLNRRTLGVRTGLKQKRKKKRGGYDGN